MCSLIKRTETQPPTSLKEGPVEGGHLYDDGSDGVHQPTSYLTNLLHFKQYFAFEAHLVYSSIVRQPIV